MSAFNLREFNTLSQRHNYFMANNRIEGFPTLIENSLILRKILESRNSNSSDKRFENNIKPKKIVRFTKPENIPYNKIYQSPILIKKKYNNSNGANRPRRLVTNLSKNVCLRSIAFNTNNQIIMSPQKDKDNEVNKNLSKPYYKIRIYSKNAYKSPEVNNPRTPTFNNINSFDNEREPHFLSFNGRKFFTNSFCGINSDTQSISPERNLNKNNANKIGTELFRNYDELNKKQFEIYKRKIKKNPITTREEFYEKQKEKQIKRKNLNIQFQKHMNDVSNDENKMRIIPITKKTLNNINNIKRINNRFRSKKKNYNSNNNINHNHKSLSFIINDNNNSSMNKTVYNNVTNNYNKNNNISFSKESNTNNNSPICDNILYSKKEFKSNNIYISKYSSPRKIDEDYFMENSDTIRQRHDQIESPNNDYNNKTHSLDRHNNPYNFIVPKKKFVEDYTFKKEFTSPVFLSSNDYKVCIKMHILHGINELFYGKVKTKEKLKMQRVISICFVKEKEIENEDNNENNEYEKEKENKNVMVGANFMKNRNPKNKFDLKSLSSIKEEEEKSKSKLEHDTTLLKNEIKKEIKEENGEENNKKKDEKINSIHNPELDKNKEEENQSQNQNDNQKVRIKLLKEKPEIELIKLEPKVETKDNKNSDNNIKRRRFLRSYPNLMSDLVNEKEKVEIKEENDFRYNIRRKYERSKDKSETKKDEPKIEIKDNKNSDKNIRRRFQRSYPNPEVETSKNETKDDKKENQNKIGEIKSFRRRFQRSNPKPEPELNKNEQKNDIKENKNQINNIGNNNNFEQKDKDKDEKPKIESKPKLIEIEQNIEIKEKPNFRKNYRSRRRIDNSSENLTIKKETKNELTEKKNLEENTTKRRRITSSKLESDKQLKDIPSTESNENLNSNNRFVVRRFKRSKQENELKPEPVKYIENNDKKENQSQNIDKNYRRRFRKSETEINLKYNIKDNQIIEKDNIKRYEKLEPEKQKQSLKKEIFVSLFTKN